MFECVFAIKVRIVRFPYHDNELAQAEAHYHHE